MVIVLVLSLEVGYPTVKPRKLTCLKGRRRWQWWMLVLIWNLYHFRVIWILSSRSLGKKMIRLVNIFLHTGVMNRSIGLLYVNHLAIYINGNVRNSRIPSNPKQEDRFARCDCHHWRTTVTRCWSRYDQAAYFVYVKSYVAMFHRALDSSQWLSLCTWASKSQSLNLKISS